MLVKLYHSSKKMKKYKRSNKPYQEEKKCQLQAALKVKDLVSEWVTLPARWLAYFSATSNSAVCVRKQLFIHDDYISFAVKKASHCRKNKNENSKQTILSKIN